MPESIHARTNTTQRLVNVAMSRRRAIRRAFPNPLQHTIQNRVRTTALHAIAHQTTHAPNCRNNAAHDSGTLFGSARYWSSNASKYIALEAFKKSSRIALFGVGAGAFVAIGAAARSVHGESAPIDVDVTVVVAAPTRVRRVVNVL